MKKMLALLCAFAFAGVSATETEITDSTTGTTFPTEVSFSFDGKNYDLNATGVSTRKKFVVKVYSVASYLQKDAPAGDQLAAIMDDKYAKQLTLKWVRGVEAAKVQEGFRDSFSHVFAEAEKAAVQSDVDKFIGFFSKDVAEGEEQTIRWIPGGTVEVQINGSQAGTIQNPAFAKGLLNIWFGDKSVVDRKELLSQTK